MRAKLTGAWTQRSSYEPFRTPFQPFGTRYHSLTLPEAALFE